MTAPASASRDVRVGADPCSTASRRHRRDRPRASSAPPRPGSPACARAAGSSSWRRRASPRRPRRAARSYADGRRRDRHVGELAQARELVGPTRRPRLGPPRPSACARSARRRGATLIAIGVRPHRRLSALTFGGHEIEALHDAPCSVLVARPGWGPRARRIVVGVDGSPGSRTAEAVARSLAERLGCEVVPTVGLQEEIDLPLLGEEREDALVYPGSSSRGSSAPPAREGSSSSAATERTTAAGEAALRTAWCTQRGAPSSSWSTRATRRRQGCDPWLRAAAQPRPVGAPAVPGPQTSRGTRCRSTRSPHGSARSRAPG